VGTQEQQFVIIVTRYQDDFSADDHFESIYCCVVSNCNFTNMQWIRLGLCLCDISCVLTVQQVLRPSEQKWVFSFGC
jgi:hypothetical protein